MLKQRKFLSFLILLLALVTLAACNKDNYHGTRISTVPDEINNQKVDVPFYVTFP